jgi:hypothetical protein
MYIAPMSCPSMFVAKEFQGFPLQKVWQTINVLWKQLKITGILYVNRTFQNCLGQNGQIKDIYCPIRSQFYTQVWGSHSNLSSVILLAWAISKLHKVLRALNFIYTDNCSGNSHSHYSCQVTFSALLLQNRTQSSGKSDIAMSTQYKTDSFTTKDNCQENQSEVRCKNYKQLWLTGAARSYSLLKSLVIKLQTTMFSDYEHVTPVLPNILYITKNLRQCIEKYITIRTSNINIFQYRK